jgi:hypothetical protein
MIEDLIEEFGRKHRRAPTLGFIEAVEGPRKRVKYLFLHIDLMSPKALAARKKLFSRKPARAYHEPLFLSPFFTKTDSTH